MAHILRKTGWVLNPDDEILNNIIKSIELNHGECLNIENYEKYNSYDRKCPCKEYRENDKCYCGLYLKVQK